MGRLYCLRQTPLHLFKDFYILALFQFIRLDRIKRLKKNFKPKTVVFSVSEFSLIMPKVLCNNWIISMVNLLSFHPSTCSSCSFLFESFSFDFLFHFSIQMILHDDLTMNHWWQLHNTQLWGTTIPLPFFFFINWDGESEIRFELNSFFVSLHLPMD